MMDLNEDGIIDRSELDEAIDRLNSNALGVELCKLHLGQQWIIQCLSKSVRTMSATRQSTSPRAAC